MCCFFNFFKYRCFNASVSYLSSGFEFKIVFWMTTFSVTVLAQ